jgi:DNA-binding HxlR family transcriptional regulator
VNVLDDDDNDVPEPSGCRAREVLARIGDKWSLYVVHLLGTGTKRFSELRREIEGIAPRMLTVTVRSLERDGLVTRTVYPVVPPRVEYALTPMGETLLDAVTGLLQWADAHLGDIDAARALYDRTLEASNEAANRSVL